MLKNLPLFIGLRYTRSKRREGFISFISGFSLVAMALGVMALITVLSVMNGFDSEIKLRILRVVSHATLTTSEGLDRTEQQALTAGLMAQGNSYGGIKSVSPVIQSHVMLAAGDRQSGALVQAVLPDDSTYASQLQPHMISGDLLQLQSGEFGIVLGSQLARKLGVFIGDRIRISLPSVSVTPAGLIPRSKAFTLVGIFKVGAQVDASVALINLADAQKLMRLGDKVQGLSVQLQDAYRADQFVAAQKPVAGQQWQTWTSEMGTLFSAMRMEKIVVGLLLSVIITVAAFNIIATLVLMVSSKRSDIAVIRTLGAESRTIMRIFMVQGMAIGTIGIIAGTALGCALAFWIGDLASLFERLTGLYLFDPSVYMISALPSELRLTDVVTVVGAALLISFLVTLYPAWRAGQVLPAEALRYDH